MSETSLTLENVISIVLQWPPRDRIRLIERVLPSLEQDLDTGMGFGMWADDESMGDSVEYVTRLRESQNKSLAETVQELEEWQKQAS
jgi:hypothetical protein